MEDLEQVDTSLVTLDGGEICNFIGLAVTSICLSLTPFSSVSGTLMSKIILDLSR